MRWRWRKMRLPRCWPSSVGRRCDVVKQVSCGVCRIGKMRKKKLVALCKQYNLPHDGKVGTL